MTRNKKAILAGEYALGSLSGKELESAENLLSSDADFARKVETWEQRLSPLTEALPEEHPPASVWNRINAVLASGETGRVLSFGELATQVADMKRALAIWRYSAVTAVAAAVAFALVWIGGLQTPFFQPQVEERYVAMLQNENGETGFVVTMMMKGKQFAIKPIAAKAPPGKIYELWCIMLGNDKPPLTAGLVGTEAYAMMNMPAELSEEELKKGVRLAMSLESPSGAVSGQSMGPVMYAGLLVKQSP